MKIKDLRIGNIVLCDSHVDGYGKIDAIEEGDLVHIENCGKYNINKGVTPMQLKKELLLRLGFNTLGFGSYGIGGFKLVTPPGDGFLLDDGKLSEHVNYVHELQNLYYKKIGKEISL